MDNTRGLYNNDVHLWSHSTAVLYSCGFTGTGDKVVPTPSLVLIVLPTPSKWLFTPTCSTSVDELYIPPSTSVDEFFTLLA